MTRDEIVAFFDRRQAAWRALDAAALTADHAPDASLVSPTVGTVKGRDAIERSYRLWFAAFPDLECTQEYLLIDGPKVAVPCKVVGTHKGEFFGLAASGKRFELRAVFIYTLGAGQIVDERRILDFTGLLVQLGVLKTRPG